MTNNDVQVDFDIYEATKKAIQNDNPNVPTEEYNEEAIIKLAAYFESCEYSVEDILAKGALPNTYFLYDIVKSVLEY